MPALADAAETPVEIPQAGAGDVDALEVDGELAGGLKGSHPELTPFVRQREARLDSL